MTLTVNPALQIEQSGRYVEVRVMREGRVWLSSPLYATWYGQRLRVPAQMSSVAEAEAFAMDAARFVRGLRYPVSPGIESWTAR